MIACNYLADLKLSSCLVSYTAGVTAILHTIVLILLLSLPCPTSPHLYNISYLASFLTMWTLRISVFYNLLLFVIRTVKIVSPFFQIKRSLVRSLLVCVPWIPWFPLIIHQMTVKYDEEDYVSFKMRILSSSYLVGEGLYFGVFGFGHYPVLLLCVFIPFVIPSVISVFSLPIQVKCLLFKSSSVSEKDPVKAKAAATILILTLVFTICNSSSFSFWLTICLNTDNSYLTPENAVWIYVTGVIIPFLNSALSPTILILRGNSLRRDVREVFQKSMSDRGPSLIKSKSVFASRSSTPL